MTKYDKAVSVCFSGHRSVPFAKRRELKQCLKSEIAKAYADGYRYFYCGMAMGFDLLAAEAALSLQCELKDLQVIAVVPFRGQSDRWSKEEQAKYDAILRIVDDVVVLSEQYYNGCLLRRNDYMVNRSSRLIAYFDGNPKGGTFYTVREAKRQGLDIVNLHNRTHKTENAYGRYCCNHRLLLRVRSFGQCAQSFVRRRETKRLPP